MKHTPHDRLPHLPRYLKAMLRRGARAYETPAKDAQRARLLAPFRDWKSQVPEVNYEASRWMLEESASPSSPRNWERPSPLAPRGRRR